VTIRPLWAPWRLEYVEQADERTSCIFCDPEPELVLHRGAHAFLLLNRFPYSSGHLMAAPYRHTAAYGGLTDEETLEIHRLAAEAMTALDAEYRPHAYNLGWNLGRSAGAGVVDHVHMHVVPRWTGDTNFMPVLSGVKVIPEALAATAERLRARLD
jgi:ATP adenylyltransferase